MRSIVPFFIVRSPLRELILKLDLHIIFSWLVFDYHNFWMENQNKTVALIQKKLVDTNQSKSYHNDTFKKRSLSCKTSFRTSHQG